jgi:hypothetical protein
MRAAWEAWVRWTSHREAATSLALFRVAVALVLAWDLVDVGLSGAYGLLWRDAAHGGLNATLGWDAPLSVVAPSSPAVVDAVYAVTLAGCAAMIVGVGGRLASFVTLQGALVLFGLHPGSGGGHDRLITIALFLLTLSRSEATLSLTTRLRTGSWTSDEPVPAWPRWLLVHQLAVMYVSAGVVKLGAEWWPHGGLVAVYRSLVEAPYARADWSVWAARLFPLTQLATLATVLFEASWWLVPLWMWLRATEDRGGRLRSWASRVDLRVVYLAIGVVLHGSLAIALNLGPFSAITLAYYLALFRPEELRRPRGDENVAFGDGGARA